MRTILSFMTQAYYHLLVVDDDARLQGLLQRFLTDKGYDVTVASNAAQAREKIASTRFDLVILDIMMPGETGLELTKSLRDEGSIIPILLLTALGEPHQRVEGLEQGADDYVTKPFEPKELVLRIQRILERVYERPAPTRSDVRFGPFQFDIPSQTLSKGGGAIYLTPAEESLLTTLVENAGSPLDREELAQKDGVNVSPRSIDVQITRLRRKIEEDPKKPLYLRTVRHRGYALYTT